MRSTRTARQRGALSLLRVAVFSALVAAAAMAGLYSVRHERNLFADGLDKVAGSVHMPAPQAQGGALRKCIIDGKPVVSNTDCTDSNPTSKTIAIHDSHGIEAPKQAAPVQAGPTSDPALDKMIEKQLR